MTFAEDFLRETQAVISALDVDTIESCAKGLAELRERDGRLFILGVGGSAGHASHAVNDFRKICGIEAYTPTDNVSELTARTNDEGWESTFIEWLRCSRLAANDAILVFSVAVVIGNAAYRSISSRPRVRQSTRCVGVRHCWPRTGPHRRRRRLLRDHPSALFVTRDAAQPRACVPVVWHLLVTHPILTENITKWESVR